MNRYAAVLLLVVGLVSAGCTKMRSTPAYSRFRTAPSTHVTHTTVTPATGAHTRTTYKPAAPVQHQPTVSGDTHKAASSTASHPEKKIDSARNNASSPSSNSVAHGNNGSKPDSTQRSTPAKPRS